MSESKIILHFPSNYLRIISRHNPILKYILCNKIGKKSNVGTQAIWLVCFPQAQPGKTVILTKPQTKASLDEQYDSV